MNSRIAHGRESRQGGFVLVGTMALVLVLIATGLAFLHWSVDESRQSVQAAASMKAYYLGQMGVVEQGFQWLRLQPANALPPARQTLPRRQIDDQSSYDEVIVERLSSTGSNGFWARSDAFRIQSTGVVKMPVLRAGREEEEEVKRTAVLYVQVRSFSDYMYLSDYEMTRFGDRIKFWHGDTLNGRVHSNTQIAIMQDPQFHEQVTQGDKGGPYNDFWRGSAYNPGFRLPPIFHAPEVVFPEYADDVRSGATFLLSNPDAQAHAKINGGTLEYWWWRRGTPEDSNANRASVPIQNSTFFFDVHTLDVEGILSGRLTLASSGNMRLIDNVRYADANPRTGVTPPNSPNILGLVSEHDVKIANTPANGRDNSAIPPQPCGPGNGQTNPSFTDIVITAAVVALGESFTFEQQNDIESLYVSDCRPDDRGTIYLFGSLTQKRRGYVHRSTNQSSGYLKKYVYDERFQLMKPPSFFSVRDNDGRALWNVVQWGQGHEAPDVANNPERAKVRFN